ncbi:MAG: GNAT family N-acetyltransferase [Armatimonadota bacterium]
MSEAKVRLRAHTEADLPNYVTWLNDPEVTEFTALESGKATLEGEREWFAHISDPACRDRNWAIEAGGRHIGNCALHLDSDGRTASFGIIIGDKSAWNKGYGTTALREVLRIGFEEMGLHRIHLQAFAGNARGIRCYEKCGFRREGVLRQARYKRGKWADVVTMAILKEEWQACREASPDAAVAGSGDPALQVQLCALGPGHIDEVLALWSQTDFWPHTGEDRDFIARALARNHEYAVGYRISGELVATTIGTFDGFRGWIYRVAVHPDHRRRGIASALVTEVERRLVADGARQINLMVYKPNAIAHALYAKLGYEPSLVDVLRKRFAKEEPCCGPQPR